MDPITIVVLGLGGYFGWRVARERLNEERLREEGRRKGERARMEETMQDEERRDEQRRKEERIREEERRQGERARIEEIMQEMMQERIREEEKRKVERPRMEEMMQERARMEERVREGTRIQEERRQNEEDRTEERPLASAEAEGRAASLDSDLVSGQPLYKSENLRDLYQAVTQSSLPELQRLATSDVDLEHRYEGEKRVLHLACESGSLEVCKFLLNRGVNFAARDYKGRTPLLSAVENGRLDILKYLVSLGIDASVRDSGGRTAVLIAVEQGKVGILQELYARRTPGPAEHTIALQEARHRSNPEVIAFLENEEILQAIQRVLELDSRESEGSSLQIAPEPIVTGAQCRKLYSVVIRQISEPNSLSKYVDRVVEATSGISEGPHNLTLEESQLFATLYRAIFNHSAKNDKASAAAHLTVLKIIAKKLGLENEIDMNHTFGPEPRLYALSVSCVSRRATSQILREIRRCLEQNRHADSFGSLFNVGISTNTKVMCCVFGSRTPDKFIAPTELICEGIHVPVLIIEDSVNEAATSNPPSSWVNKAVHYAEKIDLSGYSVGQQGNMEEAGSFGFYGNTDKKACYGFTAAHCAPGVEDESIIVSPITRELTGRLKVAVQYTSFAPHPVRIVRAREDEVRSLLRAWQSEDSDEGCRIRETTESGEIRERTIKLLGQKFGKVKGKSATYVEGVLENHNRLLDQHNFDEGTALNFCLPDDDDVLEEGENDEKCSRIEWCCFEVSSDRLGGNTLNSDTREDAAVIGISLLKPDMKVSKIGRTTGETVGTVNGCIIQRWVDRLSMEIGVLGEERLFADVGDSGALLTTVSDKPCGVGMLIGKNALGTLVLVSPLWAILEDVEAKLKQRIDFYTK